MRIRHMIQFYQPVTSNKIIYNLWYHQVVSTLSKNKNKLFHLNTVEGFLNPFCAGAAADFALDERMSGSFAFVEGVSADVTGDVGRAFMTHHWQSANISKQV